MGFLTDDEDASLRLARMCLHIIGGDDEFEPRSELAVQHDDFLIEVLKKVATDSVYCFSDSSSTKSTIDEMAKGNVTFEGGAQRLAKEFNRLHLGSARDGAFFVFELAVDDPLTKIYALVKYDYSEALEVIHTENATELRRILEAFTRSKTAIQKAALIRTKSGIAVPMLSTWDRMGRPQPVLTDFFKNYLEVDRQRNDEELTSNAKELVKLALQDNRELLPKGRIAKCVKKANDVLRDAGEINEAVINRAVWVGAGMPDDEGVREKLNRSVKRLIKKKKLDGLAFTPARAVLPQSIRRVVRTNEGVTISYDTALEGRAVIQEKLEDGRTVFTVFTEDFSDDVESDQTRNAP